MDTNTMVELSQEFARLGADLHGDGDNDAALHRMVELGVKYVAGCSWVSITLVRGGRGRSIASSDDVATLADTIQYEIGEGPCLQAAIDDTNYLMFDVGTETRWPVYAAALRERTPIRSALSFQLPARESAALNLFADSPGAFDDDSLTVATIFAAQASSLVALYEAEGKSEHLRGALDTNRRIGAAIGVLMAQRKITQDAAFDVLREASQGLNRKLRDVADEVVRTGAAPDSARSTDRRAAPDRLPPSGD